MVRIGRQSNLIDGKILFFCDTVQNNLYNKRVRLTKKRASATGNFLSGKREGGVERQVGDQVSRKAYLRLGFGETEIHRDRETYR